MAIIYDTTMNPDKLELLATWLPAQSWYLGGGRAPALAKAGGFRLDDPRGEVGIEFMIVTDGSGDQVTSYLVPMTYRAEALATANGALIGTSEHGVFGHRWIYDGTERGQLTVRVNRILRPAGPAGQPGLTAAWRLPDGTQARGILATAEYVPGDH